MSDTLDDWQPAHTVDLTDLATRIEGACDWWHATGAYGLDEAEHTAFHFGEPCPYAVAAALILDQDDPRDVIAEWRIDLPFPKDKPPLSLNGRYHWAVYANLVAQTKAITRNAVRANDVPHLDHVHVELHYRGRTNAVKDVDNIVATLKPCIDALHQPDERSRWEPIVDGDDPRFVTWRPPVLHKAEKGKPGQLWLILRSYSASQS